MIKQRNDLAILVLLVVLLALMLPSVSLHSAQEDDTVQLSATPQAGQSVASSSGPVLAEGTQVDEVLPAYAPRSQFDAMLERPLFQASRRRQAGAISGGSAQELRETWKLTGIVLVGDEVRALFKERNGERRLRLGTGMPLDSSWVLEEINVQTVVMGSGDEQVTLQLLEPRDSTANAVPERAARPDIDANAAPLDERTREALRQLEQQAESVKRTLNE
uniref:hypothetical protein n=1 Tax=Marinobacterium profundum TaxID=1714300 RepID=UPI00082B6E37|nr:hypothetical protein [Marinobacterium profundum]